MRLRPELGPGLNVLALCLLLLGAQQLGGAAIINAKAWLAPLLIESAWIRSLDDGGAVVKPWPWADTWPVARLRVPALGVDQYVLHGDSGNALAFGPGHALGSPAPGAPGVSVIGGHRDTHFAFLRRLPAGARIELQLHSGEWRTYVAGAARIVDASNGVLHADRSGDGLLLVTCYPFDTLRVGGPMRFTVLASPARAASLPRYSL